MIGVTYDDDYDEISILSLLALILFAPLTFPFILGLMANKIRKL